MLQAVFCVDLIPTCGFMNSDILFFASVCVAGVVQCSTFPSQTWCNAHPPMVTNAYHYYHSFSVSCQWLVSIGCVLEMDFPSPTALSQLHECCVHSWLLVLLTPDVRCHKNHHDDM